MDRKEFERRQKQELNFLNSLKLPTQYFNGYVDDVMDNIEKEYGKEYRKMYPGDVLFCAIGVWAFIDWVRSLHSNIKYDEEIRQYFVYEGNNHERD